MEPLKPLKPMKPLEPLAPLSGSEAWWPDHLGTPSSSGAQNGIRYAFFAEKRCLLVETDGRARIYDSGDHAISGVRQASDGSVIFSDATGTVDLKSLAALD
jgi:hypothetical protein